MRINHLTIPGAVPATPSHHFAARFAAFILAVTVFYVDTFTSIESAIAVLYVIVLLLAAESLSRKGIWIVSFVCGSLAIVSYFGTHSFSPDFPSLLRLAVSLAALLITCSLILRNDRSRSDLIASHAALKDSERRYRSIFEQSRVALWERDYSQVRSFLMGLKATGVVDLREYAAARPEIISHCVALIRTVAANAAARDLLGTIGEIAPDGSMRRYLAPNDVTFLELMVAIFNEENSFEGKGNLMAADGQTKLVLMSMTLPDDSSKFDRIIVGMVDITEGEMTQKALLEAQAELTRASRAATVGALSASLAHELNQPLGALVVNAQTMLRWMDRDPPDLAAIRRSAERMIRDSKRASEIIRNTRSLLSHEVQVPERVGLPELIAETRALMDHDLGREDVTVDVTYGPGARTVAAVRIELQQVLINLISNAIQVMAEKDVPRRRIVIETERRDDRSTVISVRDFGPGISEEAMARLFEPFFTTKATGMGMGLSICKSMMEARGGDLSARNHTDGGAVFEITIPMSENADD
ncbi:signal transduction histidine kinase [Neorhizobium galegae]|uniref:PAS domain-containing sensor histidine kinase n=1 Tax=Neorhizobium galegae TaxID=399 RepID=UPI001AEB0702|nr:ATP-binding protein [Neorhizobium galegae]MBP2558130.1 signal transduction histidine kinase [Neorhizobium galegae]